MESALITQTMQRYRTPQSNVTSQQVTPPSTLQKAATGGIVSSGFATGMLALDKFAPKTSRGFWAIMAFDFGHFKRNKGKEIKGFLSKAKIKHKAIGVAACTLLGAITGILNKQKEK